MAAGGGGAAAVTPPRLSLLDLPDDALEAIAGRVVEPADHVALLGTCKRLRDAAHAAPWALVVRTPSLAGWHARRRRHYAATSGGGAGAAAAAVAAATVGFPTEPAAAASHLLASVVRLFATHKGLRSLKLLHNPVGDAEAGPSENAAVAGGGGAAGADWGDCGACSEDDSDIDPSDPAPDWNSDIDFNFGEKLVPRLERLTLTTLSVPDAVLNMWRKWPYRLLALSAVPLQQLHVTNMWLGATWNSVPCAVEGHASTLEELTLGEGNYWASREPDHALTFCLLGSPVFPRLTALSLAL